MRNMKIEVCEVETPEWFVGDDSSLPNGWRPWDGTDWEYCIFDQLTNGTYRVRIFGDDLLAWAELGTYTVIRSGGGGGYLKFHGNLG